MHTSYYAKVKDNPNAVSIAGYPPKWYTGRQYKKLAPLLWFFRQYKEDGDQAKYTKHFHEEVLAKLDPHQVYEELGPDAILICWEKGESGVAPEKQATFCHRHLVSAWLSKQLNITVTEL